MLYVLSLGISAMAGIGGQWVPFVHRRVVSRDMILGNLPPTTYNGFGGERGGEGREGIALMAVPILPLSLLSLSFLFGYVSEDSSAFRPNSKWMKQYLADILSGFKSKPLSESLFFSITMSGIIKIFRSFMAHSCFKCRTPEGRRNYCSDRRPPTKYIVRPTPTPTLPYLTRSPSPPGSDSSHFLPPICG